MLITRIKFLESELHSLKHETKDQTINVNTEDYKLNYNTKENYVEHLHEKLRFMEDQLGGNTFSDRMQEAERVK